MELEIKICHNCKSKTTTGRPWRTGAWLCEKCYDKWSENDKKMRESDSSVSESVVKRARKGRKSRGRIKKIVTEVHKNGEQSRLNIY